MNHIQWVHTSTRSSTRQLGAPLRARARERALQAQRRQLAQPEHAVDVDRVVDVHAPLPAPRRRRGAPCRRPDTPTSAGRTRPRRVRASGARPRTGRPARRTRPSAITSGGALTRLRISGAATPAATTPQAVALIAARQPHCARSIWSALGARSSRRPGALEPALASRLARIASPPRRARRSPGSPCPPRGATARRARTAGAAGSIHSIASGSSSSVELPLTAGPPRAGRRPGGGGTWSRGELARGARGQRALAQPHVVVGAVEGADHAPVLLVAEALGQVLQQRAAAGDVDQLHPPADPQHRQVALDRRARERDLERVALGHRVHASRGAPPRRMSRGRCRRRRRAPARRSARALRRVLGRAADPAGASARARRRAGRPRRSCAAAAPPAGPTRSSAPARAPRTCRSRVVPHAHTIGSTQLRRAYA